MIDWGDVIETVTVFGALCGVPMLFIWTKHKQRMTELLNLRPHSDQTPIAELAKLQQEVARLRDTTTQYDMTVERALSELQQRIASIESAKNSTEYTGAYPPPRAPYPPVQPTEEASVQQINQRSS